MQEKDILLIQGPVSFILLNFAYTSLELEKHTLFMALSVWYVKLKNAYSYVLRLIQP